MTLALALIRKHRNAIPAPVRDDQPTPAGKSACAILYIETVGIVDIFLHSRICVSLSILVLHGESNKVLALP